MDLANSGTKALRGKVWFANVDKSTEEVRNCHPKQASTPKNAKPSESLKMTPMSSGLWKDVSSDIAETMAIHLVSILR